MIDDINKIEWGWLVPVAGDGEHVMPLGKEKMEVGKQLLFKKDSK